MKLKTILIGGMILLTVFLIYLTTLDKLVYFVALGDSIAAGKTPYGKHDQSYNNYILKYLDNKKLIEKYIDDFIIDDYRATDLVRDIKDNKKLTIDGKSQSIKNALIKADLVTLSIGMNDLYYKINTINIDHDDLYEHIDEFMEDIEKLFIILREYCKEDIFVINFYRNQLLLKKSEISKHFDYANNELQILAHKYKINYIKVDNKLENNNQFLPQDSNYLPSRSGHEVISSEIIKSFKKTLLK